MKRWFVPIFVALAIMGVMFSATPSLAVDKFCEQGENPKVNSAFGCVPVRVDAFLTWFLPYLFGIAGGISFLLMVYGFILMTMSSGDPKAVAGAQATITSAIMGLFVSLFAIFILRLVAVGILQIPGLN